MKEGWQIKTLGEVCEIINGDRGKNYPAKNKLFAKGEYPFISALNIENNTVSKDNLLFLSEKQYNLLGQGKLKLNDVVVCIRGSLGKSCIYPFEKGAIASSLVILRVKSLFNSWYLLYFLKSPLFFLQIENNSNGAAQPNLGASKLKEFTIPIPSLTEQERIVGILDREFERIEAIKANAQQALQASKDLFQAELRQALTPKDGWEVKTLGDICEIINGRGYPCKMDKFTDETPFPIYGSGGIMGYTSDYLCKEGTVIIGRKGSINNPFVVNERFWNVDTAFGLSAKNNCLKPFLFYICKNINFLKHNKGTTIPSLVKSDISNISIPIPPLSEQEAIVSRLDAVSATCKEIERNSQEIITQCEALKQSLLRKAFEGEL